MSVEVRQDNTREWSDAFGNAIGAALEEIGLVAEGYAKRMCPVDTGRLRNSITHQARPSDRDVLVGTNVEYGQYVELGTSRTAAQPFLVPAARDHKDVYEAILRRRLGGS